MELWKKHSLCPECGESTTGMFCAQCGAALKISVDTAAQTFAGYLALSGFELLHSDPHHSTNRLQSADPSQILPVQMFAELRCICADWDISWHTPILVRENSFQLEILFLWLVRGGDQEALSGFAVAIGELVNRYRSQIDQPPSIGRMVATILLLGVDDTKEIELLNAATVASFGRYVPPFSLPLLLLPPQWIHTYYFSLSVRATWISLSDGRTHPRGAFKFDAILKRAADATLRQIHGKADAKHNIDRLWTGVVHSGIHHAIEDARNLVFFVTSFLLAPIHAARDILANRLSYTRVLLYVFLACLIDLWLDKASGKDRYQWLKMLPVGGSLINFGIGVLLTCIFAAFHMKTARLMGSCTSFRPVLKLHLMLWAVSVPIAGLAESTLFFSLKMVRPQYDYWSGSVGWFGTGLLIGFMILYGLPTMRVVLGLSIVRVVVSIVFSWLAIVIIFTLVALVVVVAYDIR